MDLCARLSIKNRGVIKVFIEVLMKKEKTASQRLLELEKQLEERKAVNLELSERVSSLEKTVAIKDATKEITFPVQVTKGSTKVATKAGQAEKGPRWGSLSV